MFIILPRVSTQTTDEVHSDIPDYPFMKECKSVLTNIPKTWKQYPDTVEGRCNIISMEYNELMKTKSNSDKLHELVHLASACLHLWRNINATNQ